ncbi:MAG: hypothetical protein DSY89_00600 [Deltaproteobacteria bacterium]|nr:MAG: hypothetical protein DSY89_00600 [Deltaproteobacteria bacterium]
MNCRFLFIFIIVISIPTTVPAMGLKYELNVQIDTGHQKITGMARLVSDQKTRLHLSINPQARLKLDGRVLAGSGQNVTIDLSAGTGRVLTFETVFNLSKTNYIDPQNVFLTGNWYPRPDSLAEYALSVTLPKGFLAVSEADSLDVVKNEKTDTFRFYFTHPVDGLSLAASRNYVRTQDNYKDIQLEAYFFAEDTDLAGKYLAFTKKYLAMYEKMLTPYPYRRFVIAENLFPTGYSMPTYTLLGKAVMRLPFIPRTSLGHEILHQWFGNSVYIDASEGNWAEGATDYLADQHYAELEGKGAEFRKQILINYNAYVNASNAMPLTAFSHRRSRAESAIGYGRAAMVFHALRQRTGEKQFLDAMRDFLSAHLFRKASWKDILASFEKTGQIDPGVFFSQCIERRDIPRLHVEDSELAVVQGKLTLDFVLVQDTSPCRLHVPVTIHRAGKKTTRFVDVSQARESIHLPLDGLPVQVVIDENYDLMRELSPVEVPAALATIMGKDELLVVAPDKQPGKYQPVIDALGVEKVIYQTPEAVTFAQIKAHTVIIAGFQQPVAGMLFGRQPEYQDGVRLHVHQNPYNPEASILLLHVKNIGEAKAVQRKLPHYGKYDKLVFNQGKIRLKQQPHTRNGIFVLTRSPATVVRPDATTALNGILPEIMDRRVIYVGEQHGQYAHHINQLAIIQKLHEAGRKVAVGMEMFQVPYQPAIDDYLAGRIDERQFLKRSAYFEKWRFDYNLYKPIIDYARKEHLPLVALNIEGDISRKVARKGISGLSVSEKAQLPPEMDFSNSVYRQDLLKVFRMHENQQELKAFDFFYQSQILWDETMAESIHRFLATHAETTLVVIAGNGHVRYKYGIPNRVFRRNGLPFTVIVQDEEISPGIADFVLQTTFLKGKKAPLLGVGIEEKENGVLIASITDNSPAGKAGLKIGDIIVQVDGEKIKNLVDLKFALFYTPMDSTISLHVDRKGKIIAREVRLFDFRRH